MSNCSEIIVFLILCDVSSFFYKFFMEVFFLLLELLVVYIYIYIYRNRGWVAFLSYFWLEIWGSRVGKCEGSGKILVELPF